MKILEQIKKANDRLIKHIEKSIDLLEIDVEFVYIQSFYIYIDDLSYILRIIKQRHAYKYDFSLIDVEDDVSSIFRACFKFDEHTGKVKITKIYENDILGIIS
jgi:hypothetical protein